MTYDKIMTSTFTFNSDIQKLYSKPNSNKTIYFLILTSDTLNYSSHFFLFFTCVFIPSAIYKINARLCFILMFQSYISFVCFIVIFQSYVLVKCFSLIFIFIFHPYVLVLFLYFNLMFPSYLSFLCFSFMFRSYVSFLRSIRCLFFIGIKTGNPDSHLLSEMELVFPVSKSYTLLDAPS